MRLGIGALALLSAAVALPAWASDGFEVSSASRGSLAPTRTHLSAGVGAESLGGDFGMAATVTSPFFCDHLLAVRSAFTEFTNHGLNFAQQTNFSLSPYGLVRLGAVLAYPVFGDRLRLSVSPGLAYAFQTAAYSTGWALKGYLAFETEYLPREFPALGVFLDLGAMQNSIADKYSPTLVYAGGFDASIGLRRYF
jgi:hypothetical protein